MKKCRKKCNLKLDDLKISGQARIFAPIGAL